MRALVRILSCLLALALLVASPMGVSASLPDPDFLDNRVLLTAPLEPPDASFTLIVQATSLPHTPFYYLITLVNLSPWNIEALQLRDRYMSPDPEIPELTRLWLPGALLPGQSASIALVYDEGIIEGGCHQLELSLTDGLYSILMDCSQPSATTIWEVPLTEEMEDYLALPPLTQPQAVGRSKAGLHVAQNGDPAVMEFVRAAQPAVVVAVDDFGWLREVKQASPSTVTIGRFIEGKQAIQGDPAAQARQFVALYAARYMANSGVDYWLGWNEPAINTIQEMQWYAAFEAERVRAMGELGLKAAIGNFSVGVPEAAEFEAFLPAIETAKEYGAILALHEYSAPSLRDGMNAAIPGLDSIEGAGALTLRYRYWYDHFLRPRNLVIPLAITEAGIDGGVLQIEGQEQFGWRVYLDDGNLGQASPEAVANYLEQLSWYDDELRRDPYVIGFAIFNAGSRGGRWASFDITELLPQLAGMVNSKG